MSLRSRVIFGFLAIALVLVAADVALAVNLQRSLVEQVDRRLQTVPAPFFREGSGAPSGGGASPSPGGTQNPNGSRLSELYFEVLNADGTPIRELPPTLRDSDPRPSIDPATALAHAVVLGQPVRPFTVGSEGSSGLRYRVVVSQGTNGTYVVIGASLREADATFRRLLWVELAATGAVLLVLGLVAFWVIRLGVRPIDQMAATADAIAEGDLSRRVEVAPPRTEVGRLGIALNGMLHQIEGAFAQRRASEDRLRRFVADASHELRTPLTSIRGYTELYRSGAITEGPQLADAMRRIEGESQRMGGLVDDMLLLARLDQGRPLESELVDLGLLAADAVADARAVEPDRPITLDRPAAPTLVVGDEQRLRQLVTNLMANARQHTPADTPVHVRVTTSAITTGGRPGDGSPDERQAVLEVADEGPGIAADDAAYVFERFYRADPSRVRDASRGAEASGAGLGLSIVDAVATAHGGRAMVASEPGHGACFRVELPLADQ
jgi:two-component system, OmpR family, sensor kinase